MLEITYYNIISNFYIKEEFQYKNFKIIPDDSGCSVVAGGVKYKQIKCITVYIDEVKHKNDLKFLHKKNSTLGLDNIHAIATGYLNIFFYKLSAVFQTKIFLNYPYYFEFDKLLYQKENSNVSMQLKVNYKDIEKFFEYQIIQHAQTLLNKESLKFLNKTKKRDLNLCYLYHSTRNDTFDLSLRLLSAWKYFEELKNLHNIRCKEYEIPEKIFQSIYHGNIIECKKIIGVNEKTKKAWLNINRYDKNFLSNFYNEIRLLIAHHQRSNSTYYDQKLYIPSQNMRADLRMGRNMSKIIDLMNQINKDYFKILQIPPSLSIEKTTSKKIKYTKRL